MRAEVPSCLWPLRRRMKPVSLGNGCAQAEFMSVCVKMRFALHPMYTTVAMMFTSYCEFFVRETLVFSGVASPVATAYALVLHATILVTMIVIGALCLRTAGLSLDMLREDSPVEEEEEKAAL